MVLFFLSHLLGLMFGKYSIGFTSMELDLFADKNITLWK